jgi:Protein of unknown function (DUF3761)
MTGDHGIYLVVALIVLAIVVITRYPAVLLTFAGKVTARCRDGSVSFSSHRCGTCSHHGDFAEFLRPRHKIWLERM